ncbi:MAG: hypothetical protein IPQ08_10445 [Chitinophagaceae bacterium]|nr:hypothetical protein [Chitinophagaceae bacterium]
MVIELKVKPNKPTPAQQEWLEYFKAIGWEVLTCFTFEEASKAIFILSNRKNTENHVALPIAQL